MNIRNFSVPAKSMVLILSCTQAIFAREVSETGKKAGRKTKREDKIKSGKLMITPPTGPAYTPEPGFTVTGGIMKLFRIDKSDSNIQRSYASIMSGFSSTGAYFFQSKLTTFRLHDKLRIYSGLNYKICQLIAGASGTGLLCKQE